MGENMFRAVLLVGLLGISSLATNANEMATGRKDESPQDEGYLLIEATRGQAAGRVKALESRSLSHDELTTQLGRSIAEILSQMANVDVAGGPRSMAQQLVIRGLDDSRAALVMDGIPVVYERGHDARWQVNPMLLEQIEITTGHFSGL
ncbi:MAG: hypothetical protein D6694_04750 [Gammaproteobacteria bacterium]|nr:MAG: hypothetical protein D6694_04750 [Gammaproteobacteria bacterium]